MIIQQPSIPATDTPPGEMPYTLPTPDPDFSPVSSMTPPTYQPYTPAPVRVGDIIYALMPTRVAYAVSMVGCQMFYNYPIDTWEHRILPDGFTRECFRRTATRDDGTTQIIWEPPTDHELEELIVIPPPWQLQTGVPNGFTLPPGTTNYYDHYPTAGRIVTPVYWNLLQLGEDPRINSNVPMYRVTWGLWELWRFPAEHPWVDVSKTCDTYISSFLAVTYDVYACFVGELDDDDTEAAVIIIPIIATLLLGALGGLSALTSLSLPPTGRRRRKK